MPGPMGRRNRGPAQKVENSGQVLKRLFGIIFKKYKFQMIIVFVCILISVLANVQGSLFIQNLIDDYITPMIQSGSRDFGPMLGAILRVAIFYAIGAASAFIYAKIMVYVTQGTMRDLRCQIFEHMESLPIKYFDTHPHGDIMSVYTNDIDTLRQMISQSIPQLFNSGITIIAVLVSMFTLSIPLTILTLIMVGVMLFVTKQLASRSGRFFAKQQADLGATNGYIEEMMNGQKVVKVFNHEKKSIEEFNELNDRLFNSSYNANKFANILMPINAQIGNISYVLCAIVGCIFALNNFLGFTIGKLVSFLTFNKSFTQPINQVSQQFNSIVMALAGADRIFKLLDEEPEVDDGYVTLVNVRKEGDRLVETEKKTGMWAWKYTHSITGETEYRELKGALVMDDVDFGYTDDKIVLHNIDLYAEPGQKIAFVGSTGAGKTTITNLINRFYDIQDGKIRYDGININKIKKGDLRRSLGIVLQDTHLFTDTVMENIRYGRLDATEEEIREAAKIVCADEFISEMKDGYMTEVNERGSKLSGGQKQLISFARTLLSDPKILVLDEATSSIDARTEKLLQQGLQRLLVGRTSFIIAHRLSTIKNCDKIMYIDNKGIAECGTHEQLIAKKGEYYKLYTAQHMDE